MGSNPTRRTWKDKILDYEIETNIEENFRSTPEILKR